MSALLQSLLLNAANSDASLVNVAPFSPHRFMYQPTFKDTMGAYWLGDDFRNNV